MEVIFILHFIDFEVFQKDWLVVIINPFKRKETVIVNNREELLDYYNTYKDEIFIGYNIRGYDQYIFKGILCDFDPYEISKFIIEDKKSGYNFSSLMRKYPLNFYDVGSKLESLKQLEAYMGNDIRETSVSFTLQRKLIKDEIEETIKYCRHDVEQTIEVFLKKKSDFDAHMDLIKSFSLPLSYVSKTQAQLTAFALGCQKMPHDDEWDISIIPTIKLKKYQFILDWFKNPANYKDGKKLEVDVCGIPHAFGLGGLHGAPKEAIHRQGLIIHVDVTSFYPSIMIEYDLLSRNVKDKSIYKQVYDKRVALKKAGKKKEQAPYKIILNATFGITNDKYSLAYDPRRNHEVCINGQLLLLDLIEKLEGHCELIQSNTDGLIIQIPDTDADFNYVDDICHEWEERTKMGLGFDIITEIYQGDVNNYVFKFADGELERKGAYVKELSSIDNDLPIVNKAIVDRLIHKIPVETTIKKCNDLIMFQKVVKISSAYKYGWHNGKRLTDKTFRVFASKNNDDTYIGKQKSDGATIEKFANTPERCFIENGDINGAKVDGTLDKQWYIDLAIKRLKEKFNVDN